MKIIEMAISKELKSITRSLLLSAVNKAIEWKASGILPMMQYRKLTIRETGNIGIREEECPNIFGLSNTLSLEAEKSSDFEIFKKALSEDPIIGNHVDRLVGTIERQVYLRPVDLLRSFFNQYFKADKELTGFCEDYFEKVCKEIEGFFKKSTIPQKYLAIIENLETDVDKAEISNGIYLHGLSTKDVQDLWSENSLIQSHYGTIGPMNILPTRIKSILYTSVDEIKVINERGKSTEDWTKARINLLKPEFEKIVTALKLLRLGSVRLGPIIHQKALIFSGERITHGGPPASYSPLFEYKLCKNDMDELRSIVKALDKIDKDNKAFKVGLDRINTAAEREDLEDAFIDAVICCEAFLLDDIDYPGELTYRMGLRAAILLGRNREEREAIYDFARKVLRLRGKIVHGKLLSDNEKSKLRDAIDLGRRIAKEMVLLNAKNKMPDWETRLFS